MHDGELNKSNFLNIYQRWSDHSTKNSRRYTNEAIKKMMTNNMYGAGIGMNSSTIRPGSSTQSYIRGLRPEFIAFDDIEIDTELLELSNLKQEIFISFKLPKSFLINKLEKLKINFDEDEV